MDLQQYRAKVYEILSAKGFIESGGEIHYPESAVMDALEYLYDQVKNIPVEHFETKIIEAVNKAWNKLHSEGNQGEGDENQNSQREP
jgi:hypothetical protein